MKFTCFAVYSALLIASGAQGLDDATEAPVKPEELHRRSVVGRVGLPLGTAVEVEAEIISGTSLRRKESDSHDLLKVTHIDGRKVETPPVMRFSVPGFVSVQPANHVFAILEMQQ